MRLTSALARLDEPEVGARAARGGMSSARALGFDVHAALPLAVLGLLRVAEEGGRRAIVLAGLSVAMLGLSYWFYGLFLALLAPGFLVWGLSQRPRRDVTRDYALAAAVKIASEEADTVHLTPAELPEVLGPAKFSHDTANRKPEVGVITGLAWTPVGGDVMFIETRKYQGKGELRLTGQLGDVMKESAQAALTLLRSRAKEQGLSPGFFETHDVHVHVPEGAIPKDGPSAGVTMLTAMVSDMQPTLITFRTAPSMAETSSCSGTGASSGRGATGTPPKANTTPAHCSAWRSSSAMAAGSSAKAAGGAPARMRLGTRPAQTWAEMCSFTMRPRQVRIAIWRSGSESGGRAERSGWRAWASRRRSRRIGAAARSVIGSSGGVVIVRSL